MNRNDFGPWGIDLRPEDFYKALAALGLIRFFSLPPNVEAITQALSESIERGLPLSWYVDRHRLMVRHPPVEYPYMASDPRFLAKVWDEIIGRYGELVGETYFSRNQPRIRLEVMHGYSDAFWLIEQLSRPELRITSVYVPLYDELGEIIWDWPLRIGLLRDSASSQLRAHLEALYETGHWLAPLTRLIDLQAGETECDLLLLPQNLRSALAATLQAPSSLSANCVLVLGRIEDTEARSLALLEALRAQVRASGIGLLHVPPTSTKEDEPLQLNWFKELIRQLSHNQPIDVALYRACRNRSVSVRPPLLFATPQLIEASQISRRIEQFANKVSHPELKALEIGEESLDLPGRWQTLGEATQAMIENMEELPWDHESDTASAFLRLTEKAAAQMEAAPPPQPKTRWIQIEVWEYGAEPRVAVKQYLRAEKTYGITVFIGSQSEKSIPADRPFNEAALPPDNNEHQLTVIFSEPQISPEPQVASIILPQQGNSTSCEFYIHVPAISRINARIAVIHRNRILQTVLLQAPVLQAEQSEAVRDEKIELITESVIRPGMQDLTGRRRFDAALLFNHGDDGAAQITKAVGRNATRIQITDLSMTVKWFDDQITEVATKWKKFESLGSKKSRNLLWACAMNGSALYDGIIGAQRVDEALATAERIQVLSARYAARFPVEFIYGRMAPLPDAPLCPKAKESLINGRCDGKCPSGADEEKVICPLGFWGLNRIIERHAYDSEAAKDLAGADFGLQSEPMAGRNRLNVLASAVVATSNNVDEVEAGSKQKVLDALDEATKKQSKCVESWKEWVSDIKGRSPSLLVLLPHTLRDVLTNQQTLEISANDRLIYANLQKYHVLGQDRAAHPVVILMGCKTAAPDIPYESFVLKFRLHGAAIVIGTGSSILGRHAATVTQKFINDISALGSGNVSFGEVMLSVRRKLMADGLLMALCLTAYGDTDWLI